MDFLCLFILEVILINARTYFWSVPLLLDGAASGHALPTGRMVLSRIGQIGEGCGRRAQFRAIQREPKIAGSALRPGARPQKTSRTRLMRARRGRKPQWRMQRRKPRSIPGPPSHQPSTPSPARNSIALPVFRLFDRLGVRNGSC
jgi:hypothetical protein